MKTLSLAFFVVAAAGLSYGGIPEPVEKWARGYSVHRDFCVDAVIVHENWDRELLDRLHQDYADTTAKQVGAAYHSYVLEYRERSVGDKYTARGVEYASVVKDDIASSITGTIEETSADSKNCYRTLYHKGPHKRRSLVLDRSDNRFRERIQTPFPSQLLFGADLRSTSLDDLLVSLSTDGDPYGTKRPVEWESSTHGDTILCQAFVELDGKRSLRFEFEFSLDGGLLRAIRQYAINPKTMDVYVVLEKLFVYSGHRTGDLQRVTQSDFRLNIDSGERIAHSTTNMTLIEFSFDGCERVDSAQVGFPADAPSTERVFDARDGRTTTINDLVTTGQQ